MERGSFFIVCLLFLCGCGSLHQYITLGEEDLGQPDIWDEFISCFVRSKGLFNKEILDGFCRKLLKDIIAENVQYVETRSDIASQEITEEIERDHMAWPSSNTPC